MMLATKSQPRHNALAPFNSGAGRENLFYVGGHRRESGFFVSERLVVPSMAGRAGQPSGWSVPTTDILTPVRTATHREKWMAVTKPLVGGHAMSKFARAIRALLSRTHSVSVIRSASTLSEARRIAAHLVDAGARCRITAVAHGFDVEVL